MTVGWFAQVKSGTDQVSVMRLIRMAEAVHEPEYQFRILNVAETMS
ncbi:hypothetical protein [Mumia sp. ZJ1417]|nr:hypothetical protein [Mumia sp. ZJ1417]